MLKISIEQFDDLSNDEKECASDNGVGKECASYLRICNNGQTILLESSAIAPEDVSFYRDLSWVAKWMMKMYEIGKSERIASA